MNCRAAEKRCELFSKPNSKHLSDLSAKFLAIYKRAVTLSTSRMDATIISFSAYLYALWSASIMMRDCVTG